MVTNFQNKLLISISDVREGMDRWIPQPEDNQIECALLYDGDGEGDKIQAQFRNKYIVTYDIHKDKVKIGIDDDTSLTNTSVPNSILINKNKAPASDGVYKEIPRSGLNLKTIKVNDLRWFGVSYLAEDQDAFMQEVDRSKKEADSQKEDKNMWYQISRLYDLPAYEGRDPINVNYRANIVLNFNEIVSYQETSQITTDEILIYLGSFAGVLFLLQKLIIWCIVRPRFEAYLS